MAQDSEEVFPVADGTTQTIHLDQGGEEFFTAELDGKVLKGLLKDKTIKVNFPGEKMKEPYHRKLAVLESCDVPVNAEALYEATIFSTDNNAL